MTATTLARAADGTINLHLWREGREYLRQKGPAFLLQWNNIVFAALPGAPLANTRYVDLTTTPLDYADGTFDAAYAYHVFEHLPLADGERCARQILRMLKPGGVFRISVPDLEETCRHYLAMLEAAASDPTPRNTVRYRWAVMAIFEQMVRDRTGGLMLDAIKQGDYDTDQLREMFGDMLLPLVDTFKQGARQGLPSHQVRQGRSFNLSELLRRMYRRAGTTFGLSRPRPANRLDPRFTKEAGQWMYDRLSLRSLFEQAGFEDVRQTDHASSSIAGWSGYDFDRSNNGGHAIDPSVYMEGRKPGPGR